MQIVLLGILSFFLIVFTKDLFNPACITSVVWFVISIAYTQIEHDLFPLSLTFFYSSFILGIFIFILRVVDIQKKIQNL